MSDIVLHISSRQDWQAAQQAGQYTAPSLSSQGFIHCSTTQQAVPVAEKFYQGRTGLVLLVVDPHSLVSKLKWEPPSDGVPPPGVNGQELFPHVYGPINLQAVVQVLDFGVDRTGKFKLPPLIRPARPDDADFAAAPLHSSMGDLADYLFSDKSHPIEKSLSAMFKASGHRFSWQYTWVLEEAGKAVGILISFPGWKMGQLQAALFGKLLPFYGLGSAIPMIGRMLPLINVLETKADEYYVSNVGVVSTLQGHGYGTRLMAFAEEQACKVGLKKCSLTVDIHNTGAVRLYERLGYKAVFTRRFTGRVAESESGFHRMVKELS